MKYKNYLVLVLTVIVLLLVSGCESHPRPTDQPAATNAPTERTSTVSGGGGSAPTSTDTPTTVSDGGLVPTTEEKTNYGELHDADDLFPTTKNYNWVVVEQSLAKTQSIIGTEPEVVSQASRNFEFDGVKGNLLVVEGRTGEDAEKAVSGYLSKGASWISSYETQDEISLGDGIKANRLLHLEGNGGTSTLLWSGNAFAFFVYLSSQEVNPYEKGKELSEDILKVYPFLYEEATEASQPSTPTPAAVETPSQTETSTAEEAVSFDPVVVGGWAGAAECSGRTLTFGYFICPGGKVRGGQKVDNLGFSVLGKWNTGNQDYGDGKEYDTLTVDYTYTAQLDSSVNGKQKESWVYHEKSDTLQWVSSCQLYLQRVTGEVDDTDCKPSPTAAGGGGQCSSDYQCGQCWECDDGTCRYAGQGAYGCYGGYSGGYVKLNNQWWPTS